MSNKYQIVVIGAGAGGLVVAIGAAKAGKKVLLIEKGHYGGDCTNFGCIPSKSLIASAHAAHAIRKASTFGLSLPDSEIDASKTLDRVRAIREKIRAHENPPALDKLGVHTLTGSASFVNPHTLSVVNTEGKAEEIFGDKIVIATGSTPLTPDLPGLESTPFLTNETIFELSTPPQSLAILGGGPIGCELAQAFQRLGTKVILIHSHEELLGREEPEAQELIKKRFIEEGITLHLGKRPEKVSHDGHEFILSMPAEIRAEQLLVATGRRPNVDLLNLNNANISFSNRGVNVNSFGQTTQSHIWAIGDATGPPFFTHMAENHGRAVLTSLLIPFKKRLDRLQPVPRATFTDPEVASFGPIESRIKKMNIATYLVPLSEVDRAICTGEEEGFIKIITKKYSSQIIGATIVAPRAGEMLVQLSTAVRNRIPLRKLSGLIFPYPIFSAGIRKAADLYLTQTLLPLVKK